ncbi:hypothetical protein L3X38_043234 [Prunus dulcis]|uniref:Uncharacterized protein n=1 Tax=Prunus dulcis TaxID=3755 RepID=A0AAD4UWQ5_PRUDU|nr:hypothetical protein L3X38_043234 [Prunus dulcis]
MPHHLRRQHLIMIIMIFMVIIMRCLPYVRGLLLQRFLWKSSNWRLRLYVRRPYVKTRSMLQELRAQMEQIVESQAPTLLLPEVAACDLVDLLSF